MAFFERNEWLENGGVALQDCLVDCEEKVQRFDMFFQRTYDVILPLPLSSPLRTSINALWRGYLPTLLYLLSIHE